MRTVLAVGVALALLCVGPSRAAAKPALESLVGTKPAEWQADRWLNSPPLHLSQLRGKVVLVRWWTASCPYCSASAPALRTFDERYGRRGLVVVGMYHHKDEGPFDPRVYEQTSRKYGFKFPLAVDPDWRTLKSWTHGVETEFTSVTFVLDKHGVIRHVHPGGQYLEGDAAYARIISVVEQLLAEP
jgi:peroxiredoxin